MTKLNDSTKEAADSDADITIWTLLTLIFKEASMLPVTDTHTEQGYSPGHKPVHPLSSFTALKTTHSCFCFQFSTLFAPHRSSSTSSYIVVKKKLVNAPFGH